MEKPLFLIPKPLDTAIEPDLLEDAIFALEEGQIIYFPQQQFQLNANEQNLLNENILKPKEKNIAYHPNKTTLRGYNKHISAEQTLSLQTMMQRYANYAQALIHQVFPQYKEQLIWGRTSYRPAEIKGRKTSKRKDDTRVHVDSFAATPVYGKRLLRVFCNINPHHQPRVWQTGESFSRLLQRFQSRLKPYNPYKAQWLNFICATKTLRSAYDHYMLGLHDTMKLDDAYQANLNKAQIEFPSGSTWVVYTDQVSHAALTGQYLLEQTFYLPVEAMRYPERAPLSQLKQHFAI